MITDIDISTTNFVDRSVVIYGETGTGKSTLVFDILYGMRNQVERIIVFSPTNRMNKLYNDCVPVVMIHDTVTEQVLTDLWDLQTNFAKAYTDANDVGNLRRLFDRIATREDIAAAHKIEDQRETMLSAANQAQAPVIRAKIDELLVLFYKNAIRRFGQTPECVAAMSAMGVVRGEEQQKSSKGNTAWHILRQDPLFVTIIRYLDLNPRIAVVFDDCTEDLDKIKKCKALSAMFFMGRWNFITTIIACHTDKSLLPECKKNVFMSIFTGQKTSQAYFDRTSSNYSTAERKQLCISAASIFASGEHAKLLMVRDEPMKTYRCTATRRTEPFRVGSEIFWKYCNTVKAKTNGAVNNKFAHDF